MLYFRFIKTYLRKYYAWLSLLLILLMLESICYSAIAYSFKFIIDGALLGGQEHILLLIFIGLGIDGVLVASFGLAGDYLQTRVIARILADIRENLFAQLQKLSMDFHSNASSGDTLLHFSTELNAVEHTARSTITWAIGPFVSLCISFTLLVTLNWQLALVIFIALPLILMGPQKISTRIEQENYEAQQKEADLLSIISENILTQIVTKTFGLVDYVTKVFKNANQNVMNKIIRVEFLAALANRLADSIAMYLQILVLCIGSYLVYKKQLSVGSLVSFQTIFTSFIYTLAYMTQYFPVLKTGESGARRLQDFLNKTPIIVDSDKPIEMKNLSKEIQFQNVTFGYTENEIILNNITLSLLAGKTTAIVGESGSGKSTLVSLILRLFDPKQGYITFDGIKLTDISQESLRFLIGYVSQETSLFNLSIGENIRLGKLDATQKEIEMAAKAAEIHDNILEMTDAYLTPVGERGGHLSGGQRQRLAIARAMIKNPPIFLLDEATSALDPLTESAVNETLNKLSKGRTTIVVTHRLDSIVHADHIYLFSHGKIGEHGKHEELLSQAGLYKNLWDKQHGFVINYETNTAELTAERLKMIPLFQNLSQNYLEESKQFFTTMSYPENHIVITEGDSGDVFFILVRGKAGVFVANGSEQIATLEDGDHFGEIALLQDIPRTATVKTQTFCTFLILRRRDFLNLVKTAPGLLEKLQHIAEERKQSKGDDAKKV